MINTLFFIVLVLNATEVFSFLAPQFGVTIGHISLVLLTANIAYLIFKLRYTMTVASGQGIPTWFFLILLWPVLTMAYAPAIDLREAGRQLYAFVLLMGTVVYAVSNGLPAMYRVLFVSFAVTIAGLGLSMVAPGYFSAVGELAGAEKLSGEGRAYGFLLQPNSLAVVLSFIFVGMYALIPRRRVMFEVGLIIVFLGCLLLTGSRAGLIVGLTAIALSILYSFRKGMREGAHAMKVGVAVVALFIGALASVVVLSNVTSETSAPGELLAKIDMMLSFRLTDADSILEDGSVRSRLDAQAIFLDLIRERPWTGHGIGAEVYYRDEGVIVKGAHSNAIKFIMEFGLLYPLLFMLALARLYTARIRRDVDDVLQTNAIAQFAVIIALLMMATYFGSFRAFYIVLGVFIAAIRFPQFLYTFDEETGRINGVLPHGDRSRRHVEARDSPAAATSGSPVQA